NNRIELLEKFMDKVLFHKTYNEAAALVLNSYRQMALANIGMAIRNGTKIYLSDRNITGNWLKKNGIQVFSVEQDFLRDYVTENLYLPEKVAKHNLQQYSNLAQNYNFDQFNSVLKTKIAG